MEKHFSCLWGGASEATGRPGALGGNPGIDVCTKTPDAPASKRHQGSRKDRAVVLSKADGKTVVWMEPVWPQHCGPVAGDLVGGNEQKEAISGQTCGTTPHPAFYFAFGERTKASPAGFPNLFCMSWMGCF